jgi:hypothetical protein
MEILSYKRTGIICSFHHIPKKHLQGQGMVVIQAMVVYPPLEPFLGEGDGITRSQERFLEAGDVMNLLLKIVLHT